MEWIIEDEGFMGCTWLERMDKSFFYTIKIIFGDQNLSLMVDFSYVIYRLGLIQLFGPKTTKLQFLTKSVSKFIKTDKKINQLSTNVIVT